MPARLGYAPLRSINTGSGSGKQQYQQKPASDETLVQLEARSIQLRRRHYRRRHRRNIHHPARRRG